MYSSISLTTPPIQKPEVTLISKKGSVETVLLVATYSKNTNDEFKLFIVKNVYNIARRLLFQMVEHNII